MAKPTTTNRAKKRFGQHFLEKAWVDKLIASLAASPDDTFLEIGPGRGALTKPLAPLVRAIVAVEIDRDLAAALPAAVPPNVRVVPGDFLDVDLDGLVDVASGFPPSPGFGGPADALRAEAGGRKDAGDMPPLRVVGNLPYNVSSPILFKLLKGAREGRRFRDATLMLQKEVADRLVATPGSGDYGTLAIQVALLADVERVLTLPPGAFRPPPKVTSTVVRLRFRPASDDVGSPDTFERLVRGIFLQRRKTLVNALKPVADSLGHSAAELIARAGLDGRLRPEALSVADFARLARAML